MRGLHAVPIAAAIGACAASPGSLEVREAASSNRCRTPPGAASFELLGNPERLQAWIESRGIDLPDASDDARHLAIEMGRRPTGGYAIRVEPKAVLADGALHVTASFVSPAEGAMVSQALTSPCILLELPSGEYDRVEVRDPAGARLPPAPGNSATPPS